MKRTTTVALPRERAEQLRALASHHGTSQSALIGGYIEKDLEQSGVNDDIPDVGIYLANGIIHLDAVEVAIGFLSAKDVLDVAGQIERIASRGGAFMIFINGGALNVSRTGSAVTLAVTVASGGTSKRHFNPDVACAVARRLKTMAERF